MNLLSCIAREVFGPVFDLIVPDVIGPKSQMSTLFLRHRMSAWCVCPVAAESVSWLWGGWTTLCTLLLLGSV